MTEHVSLDGTELVVDGDRYDLAAYGEVLGGDGPNQEFVPSSALELTEPGITVASDGTDGNDGNSGAAGAIASGATVRSERAAREALRDNDAGGFLERSGGLIHTGLSDTNVNGGGRQTHST